MAGKKQNKQKRQMPIAGEDVYIPTSLYLSHGIDDFEGGLCRIIRVSEGISAGEKVPFIEVAERPSYSYNWECLRDGQEKLKKEYGRRRGRRHPDYSSEFNE